MPRAALAWTRVAVSLALLWALLTSDPAGPVPGVVVGALAGYWLSPGAPRGPRTDEETGP